MLKNTLNVLSTQLILAVLLQGDAQALVVFYGSEDPGTSQLQSTLSFDTTTQFLNVNNVPTPQTSTFRFDFAANTMRVATQRFGVPQMETSHTIEKTVAPGQTEQWDFTATVRAFDISPTGISDSPITPSVGGIYDLDDTGWDNGDYARFEDISIMVDWEFAGPTETQSGTETTAISIGDPYFWYTELDTSGYPTAMVLGGISNRQVAWGVGFQSPAILSKTVDGLAIEWKISHLRIKMPNGGSELGTITPIPEPGSAALLMGVLFSYIALARRERKTPQGWARNV